MNVVDKALMVVQYLLIIAAVMVLGLIGWLAYIRASQGPEKCIQIHSYEADGGGYTTEEKCWREKEGPK